jgi:hypothetical protein
MHEYYSRRQTTLGIFAAMVIVASLTALPFASVNAARIRIPPPPICDSNDKQKLNQCLGARSDWCDLKCMACIAPPVIGACEIECEEGNSFWCEAKK